jgi:hypothetical protein
MDKRPAFPLESGLVSTPLTLGGTNNSVNKPKFENECLMEQDENEYVCEGEEEALNFLKGV